MCGFLLLYAVLLTACAEPPEPSDHPSNWKDGYTWYVEHLASAKNVSWMTVKDARRLAIICEAGSLGVQACAFYGETCFVYGIVDEEAAKALRFTGGVSLYQHEVHGHCAGWRHKETYLPTVLTRRR